MKQITMNPVNTTGWAVGTKLFVVPIRYWDNDAIETARVAEHTTFEGAIIPDGNDHNFVYAFGDDYGHNVYLDRNMVFTNHDEAILYRDILRAHYKMESAVDFAKVWKRIMIDLNRRQKEKLEKQA